jgi:hypothetical protein
MPSIAFASTHHDPQALLYAQTQRMLPLLTDLYSHISVVITSATAASSQEQLRAAGVYVFDRGRDLPDSGMSYLGMWRRKSVEVSLRQAPDATHIHFCDFDRILHWAEYYPDELRTVLQAITQYDFTVLGRTPRAFDSHPRVQCDTERIINHVFSLASGLDWDVTAASRGFSRRAAELLVADCDDDTIGNDCSWPLFFQRYDDIQMGHLLTEGLEFETLDRFTPEELAAVGGAEGWLARFDGDPQRWVERLHTALTEARSIVTYRKA